jgi:hypothetical protein
VVDGAHVQPRSGTVLALALDVKLKINTEKKNNKKARKNKIRCER